MNLNSLDYFSYLVVDILYLTHLDSYFYYIYLFLNFMNVTYSQYIHILFLLMVVQLYHYSSDACQNDTSSGIGILPLILIRAIKHLVFLNIFLNKFLIFMTILQKIIFNAIQLDNRLLYYFEDEF